MTQLVRFSPGANSGIAMEIEEPNRNVMCMGQAKEIEHSSHIRLLVNWCASESTGG